MSLIPMVGISKLNWNSEPLLNIMINNMKIPISKNRFLYNTKCKLLIKKYGKLKSLIKICIQNKSFINTINKYLNINRNTNKNYKREELCLVLYRYIEQTGDIWVKFPALQNQIVYKLIEFVEQNIIFKFYLHTLHYKCDTLLECGHICQKDSYLTFHQCRHHLKLKLKGELIVNQILNKNIPNQLITIINKYIHERSY